MFELILTTLTVNFGSLGNFWQFAKSFNLQYLEYHIFVLLMVSILSRLKPKPSLDNTSQKRKWKVCLQPTSTQDETMRYRAATLLALQRLTLCFQPKFHGCSCCCWHKANCFKLGLSLSTRLLTVLVKILRSLTLPKMDKIELLFPTIVLQYST